MRNFRQASILLHTIDPMGSTCKVLGFVFTHLGINSSAGLDLTWLTNFCGVCGLNCWEDPQISANKQHKVTNLTIIVLLIMPVTCFNITILQNFRLYNTKISRHKTQQYLIGRNVLNINIDIRYEIIFFFSAAAGMIRNAGITQGRALNEQISYSMIYRWLVTPKS